MSLPARVWTMLAHEQRLSPEPGEHSLRVSYGVVAPAWYAHKSPLALFSLPEATRAQLRHAETVLKRQDVIPITDLEGHVGAVGLVRNHLRQLAVHRPERHQLLRIVRAGCARPGFDVLGFRQSVRSRVTVGWIKPETITRGDLGELFKPYHWSSNGLAKMALRILDEQGDAESLLELFGCQRDLEIVVNSFPGPLGPVRPIAVNGNHRTLALEALGVPAVLAELQPYAAPYRCEFYDGDELSLRCLSCGGSMTVAESDSRADRSSGPTSGRKSESQRLKRHGSLRHRGAPSRPSMRTRFSRAGDSTSLGTCR
jgi:hypothetical protein